MTDTQHVNFLRGIKGCEENIKGFDKKIKHVKTKISKSRKVISTALELIEKLTKELDILESESLVEILKKQDFEEKVKAINIAKKGPKPKKGVTCALCNVEFKRQTRCTNWIKCTKCSRFRCTACLIKECDCYKSLDSPASPPECSGEPEVGSECCVCENVYVRAIHNNHHTKCISCGKWKCQKCLTKKCVVLTFKKSERLEKLINNLKLQLSKNN